MAWIPPLGLALVLYMAAATLACAAKQPDSSPDATRAGLGLTAVDYNFVAQANLGAPFQIDSGRVAERKATSAAIRDYAHLMVVTHKPVVEDLNAILRRKQTTAPPATLLQGAYEAMMASLSADGPATLDRDYVAGQVAYQKGNDALFRYEIQNGSDPELKQFAQRTLPKIDDHLQRALQLASSGTLTNGSRR